MLNFLTGEESKGYLKTDTERPKIMYKYAQLKIFHHDRQRQVKISDFMYVDPETMPV